MQLLDVPYEQQEDDFQCAAAALSMVYRSFGEAVTQHEIWPQIRDPHKSPRSGAPARNLVRHAYGRAFVAVVLRASQPWQLLQRCGRPDIRVIVFHRRGFGAFGLHAAVLRGIDNTRVVLHDPLGMPDRQLQRDDFLALWGPHPDATFGRSYLLAAFARGPLRDAGCSCGQPLRELLYCPKCGQTIHLEPAPAIGCGRVGCDGRHWAELICPWCEECLFPSNV